MASHVIYGVHSVRELLRSGRPIERLYVARGRRDRRIQELVRSAMNANVVIRQEERRQLDQLVGTTKHQGVAAAVAGGYAYVGLETLLDRSRQATTAPFLVMLDGVEDPHNLGATIRTAEAAGVHGLIIPERRAAGITPAAVKASAGAASHLSVARVGNLVQAIDRLKEAQLWVVGLDTRVATCYTELDWTGPIVLVAGSEGKGLRTLVSRQCDHRVSIPLLGQVHSLNVSVAIGVVLYEVVRQRRVPPDTRRGALGR